MQRVFSNSENIRLEKSVIRNGVKSVNPRHTRPVARIFYLVAIINMKNRSLLFEENINRAIISAKAGAVLKTAP